MTVAGGYQYMISGGMWVGLLAAVDLLLLLRKCQWQIRDRKRDGSVQVASLLEVHAISDYFIPCLLML